MLNIFPFDLEFHKKAYLLKNDYPQRSVTFYKQSYDNDHEAKIKSLENDIAEVKEKNENLKKETENNREQFESIAREGMDIPKNDILKLNEEMSWYIDELFYSIVATL